MKVQVSRYTKSKAWYWHCLGCNREDPSGTWRAAIRDAHAHLAGHRVFGFRPSGSRPVQRDDAAAEIERLRRHLRVWQDGFRETAAGARAEIARLTAERDAALAVLGDQ